MAVVKRIDEMDSMFGGTFVRARGSLGAASFGLNILNIPPNTPWADHDHSADGQEEVYTLLSGVATIKTEEGDVQLEPGLFVRVPASEKRQISTGDSPAQILAIGGVPGKAYEAPPYTEVGAPEPAMG